MKNNNTMVFVITNIITTALTIIIILLLWNDNDNRISTANNEYYYDTKFVNNETRDLNVTASTIHRRQLLFSLLGENFTGQMNYTNQINQIISTPIADFNESIQHIYLIGERNSGTNYIDKVLTPVFYSYGTKNTTGNKPFTFSINIPVFKFKHMFELSEPISRMVNDAELKMLSEIKDSLWLLVVRNPCDWANAMYKKPHHLCPVNDTTCGNPGHRFIGSDKTTKGIQNMSRHEFFNYTWQDFFSKTKFNNLFDLRSYKLQLMVQLKNVLPKNRIKIVKLHDFERSPDLYVQDMVTEYGLQYESTYDYGSIQPSTNMHSILCLTPAEINTVNELIDWDMERIFGFTPDDCHTCANNS